VAELGSPGIVAHGVALKPGKPLCLAAVTREEPVRRSVAVVILPGFPTSAIFTFHEFVAPVILALAGRSADPDTVVQARLPMRLNSERGRTEYVLVGLVRANEADGIMTAYPMGKGSGSVTTFSRADGFLVIPRQQEYVEADSAVAVRLLNQRLRAADLVVIGSHCVGQDYLLGRLQEQGFHCKFLAVGSTGGLDAVRRVECDMAGIHLMDPKTGIYNRGFLTPGLLLLPGYQRLQGIVYRPGDDRFQGRTAAEAIVAALADPECMMVNRNQGSGTRILIDRLLSGARPAGYFAEARSHNAVAAAVQQSRADWGVAIETVAREAGLNFLPLQEEHYDWVVRASRLDRPAVRAFQALLEREESRNALIAMGFRPAT
jgi:putative molybdopterin biosynthesis protein